MRKRIRFIGKFHVNIITVFLFWIIVHVTGWYLNEFSGFFTTQLVLTTLPITLLFSLSLSNKGKTKGDFYFGLPFINSYMTAENELKVSNGGFNFFIRIFYFILASALIASADAIEKDTSTSFSDILFSIIFFGGVLFYIIRFLKNRNDHLTINKGAISWFDDSVKQTIKVDLDNIVELSIQNVQYKSLDYPQKIVLLTREGEYTINLEEMAMLQFSDLIIQQLQSNIRFISPDLKLELKME